MFSLIQQTIRAARLFDTVLKRIGEIEATLATIDTKLTTIDSKLERFEKLAQENESLWQFLDEQPDPEGIFAGSSQELDLHISDAMLRSIKTHGDA